MKSNSLQRSPIIVKFRGVMDNTSASYAEGSEFDPHQDLRNFLKMLRPYFNIQNGYRIVIGSTLTNKRRDLGLLGPDFH